MILPPECYKRNCKHYLGIKQDEGKESTERPVCKAYPDGIPQDIAYGKAKHLRVRKDQNNSVVYEKAK